MFEYLKHVCTFYFKLKRVNNNTLKYVKMVSVYKMTLYLSNFLRTFLNSLIKVT